MPEKLQHFAYPANKLMTEVRRVLLDDFEVDIIYPADAPGLQAIEPHDFLLRFKLNDQDKDSHIFLQHAGNDKEKPASSIEFHEMPKESDLPSCILSAIRKVCTPRKQTKIVP